VLSTHQLSFCCHCALSFESLISVHHIGLCVGSDMGIAWSALVFVSCCLISSSFPCMFIVYRYMAYQIYIVYSRVMIGAGVCPDVKLVGVG
jgi:hypothetical protein